MIQAARGARFLLEPAAPIRDLSENAAGRTLTATSR